VGPAVQVTAGETPDAKSAPSHVDASGKGMQLAKSSLETLNPSASTPSLTKARVGISSQVGISGGAPAAPAAPVLLLVLVAPPVPVVPEAPVVLVPEAPVVLVLVVLLPVAPVVPVVLVAVVLVVPPVGPPESPESSELQAPATSDPTLSAPTTNQGVFFIEFLCRVI